MSSAGEQVAGVVIEPVEDLHVGPAGQAPVDEVRLPHFVRLGGLKSRVRDLGRFLGDGVISPAYCKIRLIVAAAGGLTPSCSRCRAIMTAPASNPSAVRRDHSSITRSRTFAGIAIGVVLGRRERGSSASRPPCR